MKGNPIKKSFQHIILFIVFAVSPILASWKMMETGYFTVYYPSTYSFEASQALAALEATRTNAEKYTGLPRKHTFIVIEDPGVYVNGSTNPIFERISLFTFQPRCDSGMIPNWWMDVGIHEYVHMLHLTGTRGFPRFIRNVFGTIYSPNLISPPWIMEGITVFSESQISPYSGRLNDGYYDAMIRIRAKENKFPTIQSATYPSMEVPVDSIYLYGGTFHKYLASRFGADQIAKFYIQTASSFSSGWNILFPYFGIDASSRRVFGKSMSTLWKDWNKEMIRQSVSWEWDGTRLTKNGWIKDGLVTDGKFIYFQQTEGFKTDLFTGKYIYSIIRLDPVTKKIKTIRRLTTGPTTEMQYKNGSLYYSTADYRSGFANTSLDRYGMITILNKLNLSTGLNKTLLRGEIRAYGVKDDGTVIYAVTKHGSDGADIFKLNPAAMQPEKMYSVDYYPDSFLFDGETAIITAKYEGKNYSIYSLDISSGNITPLINTPWLEKADSVKDGFILFTANYSNRYNCYQYEMASKKVWLLTKSGYASTPVRLDNTTYCFELHSKGREIYAAKSQPDSYFLSTEKEIPLLPASLATIPKEMNTGIRNGASLLPKIIIPSLSIAPNRPNYYGFAVIGNDTLDYFSYNAGIGVMPAFPNTYEFNYQGSFKAFRPLTINTMFEYDPFFDLIEGSATASRPLFYRMTPGLNGLSLSLEANYLRYPASTSLYQSTTVNPGLNISFKWPLASLDLGATSYFSANKNTPSYEGLLTQAKLEMSIKGWTPSLTIESFHSDNLVFLTKDIFGKSQITNAKASASLFITRKLISINKGWWNPNILFLGDLLIREFVKIQTSDKGSLEWKTGTTLLIEHKLSLAVDLGYGLTFYRSSRNSINNYEFNLVNSSITF